MFKNKANQLRSGWVILLAAILVLFGQFIFTLPGETLLAILNITRGGTDADLNAMAMENPFMHLMIFGASGLGGLFATLVAWRLINKRPMKELGLRGPDKDFFFGLFLGAISITVIFFFLYITGNVSLLGSGPQITLFTFSFLIIFILVGFFEEMFFRGYIMNTMASRGNKKWVIYLVSALIFSVAHGLNPNVSIIGLLNIFIVGLLFAYMFDATKSLMVPIGYHITWNFFQGNVFGFAVSGNATHGIWTSDISNGHILLTGGDFGIEGGLLATIVIVLGFVATYVYAKSKGARAV